jgi:membrane carboxypeptidase/penicillin-binding protein
VRAVEGRADLAAPRARVPRLLPDEAYLVTHLLRGVVDRGTGAAVRALGLEGAIAGKTGTTNDTRDAWFAGYSPSLVAVVWVGFDDGGPLGVSGARGALPIWTDFMRAAASLEEPGEFAVPAAVTLRHVCGGAVPDAFLPLTEPAELCGSGTLTAATGYPPPPITPPPMTGPSER